MKVFIKKTDPERDADIPLPSYMTAGSAGMDVYAAVDDELIIEPGARAPVPTGIAMALPIGWEAQIRPRSGLAVRHGLTLVNTPGTIDSDYRGEIIILMINHGSEPVKVKRGKRIAQMVIASVTQIEWEVVDELPHTERGDGGFGHTG